MPQQNPQDQTDKTFVPRNLNPLPPKHRDLVPVEHQQPGTAHIRFMGPKTGRPHERADVPFETVANADFSSSSLLAVLARATAMNVAQIERQMLDDTGHALDHHVRPSTDDPDVIEGEVVRRDDD